MPDRDQHLEQARANRAHAEELVATRSADSTALQWAVTAAFYCAVHCIEAHLTLHGIHSTEHREREYFLGQRRSGVPSEVLAAYMRLKQWSLQTRYYLRRPKPEMVRQSVLPSLGRITGFVRLDESGS